MLDPILFKRIKNIFYYFFKTCWMHGLDPVDQWPLLPRRPTMLDEMSV